MRRRVPSIACCLSLLATGWLAAAPPPAASPQTPGAPLWEEALPGLYVNRSYEAATDDPLQLKGLAATSEPAWLDASREDVASLRMAITLPLAPCPAVETMLKASGIAADEAGRRSLVVGVRDGASGVEYVAGVLYDPPGLSSGSGFYPLMKSRDGELIMSLSHRLAAAAAQPQAIDMPASPELPIFKGTELFGPCQDACDREFQNDVFLCNTDETACKLAVTGAAMGCVVGCTRFIAGGPLWWACAAACGVVDIAGLLKCIVAGERCHDTAEDDRFDCYDRCVSNDPGDPPGNPPPGGGSDPGGDDPGGSTGGGDSCADCYCEGSWAGEVCGSTASELVDSCVDRCGGFF